MREIDKLRQRLTNVKRGVVEYKMTITEATTLVEEFLKLERKLQEKSISQPITQPTEIVTNILDGGTF
jgi:hypothetical protein